MALLFLLCVVEEHNQATGEIKNFKTKLSDKMRMI